MLKEIEKLSRNIKECKKCELFSSCRCPIPGDGAENAKIMLVGEAPGATEDECGKPFVGRSGRLLTTMLSEIGVLREENMYITNTVKCRPKNNRNPKAKEIAACSEYLNKQIELIRPEVIILVGNFACRYFLGKQACITKIHGQFFDYYNAKLFCVFHPAALLRNPKLKDIAKEDLLKLKRYLSENNII